MTVLDEDRVTNICKVGRKELTCRYLVRTGGEFCCAKHSFLAPTLDEKVARGEMGSKGDNCAGV
jgi:hypothetical protein